MGGDRGQGRRPSGSPRVDKPNASLPAPQALEIEEAPTGDKIICRSVTLYSATLGVVARLDIAEVEPGRADFPHRALGQDLTPSSTARRAQAGSDVRARSIWRCNWRDSPEERQAAFDRLAAARKSADGATTSAELLGVEGDAASVYFRAFAALKSPDDKQGAGELRRSVSRPAIAGRRPVRQHHAVARLAILTRHLTIALASVGFDPYRGFFMHRAIDGRRSRSISWSRSAPS